MLIKKYKVECYKFNEFKVREELSKLDKAIGHIKQNKRKYMALVTNSSY